VKVYRIASTRGFRIESLRFPFPLTWCAERGTHKVSRGTDPVTIEPGRQTDLRTEQLFDIEVVPDSSGAATGWLKLQVPPYSPRAEPDWAYLKTVLAGSCRLGIGLELTRSMFSFPGFHWKIDRVARMLGVSPRILQMALFRESYSFAATLARCRRLNQILTDDFPFHGDEAQLLV
jgi:hypothetical protein